MLAWTRPEHDGGAKIEGYIIEFQKTGSEEWIRIAEDVPQTEHQLQGLMEKQEYSFRVKAVNKAGESEPSEPSDPVVCKERLCKPQLFLSVFCFQVLFFRTLTLSVGLLRESASLSSCSRKFEVDLKIPKTGVTQTFAF